MKVTGTAIEKSQNEKAFRAMVAQASMETGGPPTAKEREWAKKMITPRRIGSKRITSRAEDEPVLG